MDCSTSRRIKKYKTPNRYKMSFYKLRKNKTQHLLPPLPSCILQIFKTSFFVTRTSKWKKKKHNFSWKTLKITAIIYKTNANRIRASAVYQTFPQDHYIFKLILFPQTIFSWTILYLPIIMFFPVPIYLNEKIPLDPKIQLLLINNHV